MLHGGQVPCPHSLIRLATSDASQAAVPGTSYVCHCSTSSNLHSGTSRNTPEPFGAAIVALRRAPLCRNYGSDSPGLQRKARHRQAVLPLPLKPRNGCCNTHAHSGTEAWCAAPRWFVLTHTPTCSGVRVMAAAIKSSGWRSKLHANCWALSSSIIKQPQPLAPPQHTARNTGCLPCNATAMAHVLFRSRAGVALTGAAAAFRSVTGAPGESGCGLVLSRSPLRRCVAHRDVDAGRQPLLQLAWRSSCDGRRRRRVGRPATGATPVASAWG